MTQPRTGPAVSDRSAAHLAARPRRRVGDVVAGAGLVAVTAGLIAMLPLAPRDDTVGQALYACRDEVARRAPAVTHERWLVEVIADESYGHWVTGFLGPVGWSCAASYDDGAWEVEVTVDAPEGMSLTKSSPPAD